MPSFEFSPELIVIIAGGFLSIVFTYSPKLNTWFAGKSEDFKKLSMLVLMVLTTVVVFVLGCLKVVTMHNFICAQQTAVDFIYYLILAVMSNQGVFKLSPKPIAVKQASTAQFIPPRQFPDGQ